MMCWWEVDETISESCQVAGFDISGDECSESRAGNLLINYSYLFIFIPVTDNSCDSILKRKERAPF
jgi:hypothetical protein